MELIIEVCDSSGHFQNQYRFNQDNIRIGRGYNNDVILRDPHVCAEHAVIEWVEGSWRVKNLSSINGSTILRAGGKQAVSVSTTVGIHSGDAITVGQHQLFLFAPHHVVPKAELLDPSTPRLEKYSKPIVAVPILAFITVIFFISGYLAESNIPKYDRLILSAVELLGIPLVWASVWSLVGLIIVHKPRFLAHACFAGLFTLAAYLFSILSDWIVFATNSGIVAEISEALWLGLIATSLIYFSQKIGTRLSKPARLMSASAFAWGFVALALAWSYVERPEFKHTPEYESVLHPPILPHAASVSIDNFLTKTASAFKNKEETSEPSTPLP